MLAQNFMSAKELGLPKETYEAFINVLHALDRGEITKKMFDMRQIGKPLCGSAGCLIGWAQALAGKELIFCSRNEGRSSDLLNLTHPWFGKGEVKFTQSRKITPAQAAFALRTYLTTGQVNWQEAIKVT